MTRKPASRETLERLAEQATEVASNFGRPRDAQREIEFMGIVSAYLRETQAPPLRTRAEVDAEIAGITRDIVAATGESPGCWGIGKRTLGQESRLVTLCAEPTAPEGETP